MAAASPLLQLPALLLNRIRLVCTCLRLQFVLLFLLWLRLWCWCSAATLLTPLLPRCCLLDQLEEQLGQHGTIATAAALGLRHLVQQVAIFLKHFGEAIYIHVVFTIAQHQLAEKLQEERVGGLILNTELC